MTNQSLLLRALWSALGATAYIALVSAIFAYRLFGGGEGSGIVAQMAAMLLVVLSVIVMGILLLLQPLRLYLDGYKSEGVRLLLFTGMWLGTLTVLAMVIMSVA